MTNVPCIVSITVLIFTVRHFFIIEIPGSVLALRHVLRLTSRCHSTDRLLKLLDILQLVICFTALPVLLLELILLKIVLLRHTFDISVRVLILTGAIFLRSMCLFLALSSSLSSVSFPQCLNLTFCSTINVLLMATDIRRLIDGFFGLGRRGRRAFLGRGRVATRPTTATISEDIIAYVDLLRQAPWHVLTSVDRSLLLSLLALLVLFFFIGRILTVIVGHVDLVSELDTEGAAFDPRGLGLQGHRAWRQAVEDVVVYAGDHVGRLDEREAKRRPQVDGGRAINERCLHESKLVAEARLCGEYC